MERDVTVTFDYNGKCSPFTIEDNPFKVCHNKDCKENIITYDFKKGESYTIMVKLQKLHFSTQTYYVLPGYSFHDVNYNGIDSDDDIIVDDDDDNDNKDKGSDSNKIKLNLFFISLILLLLI